MKYAINELERLFVDALDKTCLYTEQGKTEESFTESTKADQYLTAIQLLKTWSQLQPEANSGATVLPFKRSAI
jgi:hypothetical protein